MHPHQKSFFITLTSNSSLDMYPQNTLSRFTSKLPISLECKNDNNGEWYAGVTKFACSKIERKINRHLEKKIMFVDVQETDPTTSQPVRATFVSIKKKTDIELEVIGLLRQYPDLFAIIQNEGFFERYKTNVDLSVIDIPLLTNVRFLIDTYRCTVTFGNEYTMREFFDILFYQIPKENRSNVIEKLKNSIISKNPTPLDDKTQKDIKRIVKLISPLIVDELEDFGIPNYMCIYCDIVQPQIFGNVLGRGMVMHPVKYQKQHDDYQNCDIVNIQYLPLEKSCITDINILIADENGEQINFKSDSFSTMVVLHFRKGI